MKGHISVEIPVKSYIKAYIVSQLGEVVKLEIGKHVISNKLFDLLEHKQNHQRTSSLYKYEAKIKIYITFETYRRRGCNLNHTNIRSFNRFVEKLIKLQMYTIMDSLIAILPSFEANLPEVRRQLGIDLEAWSDDSIKKDYYRYRLKKNKSTLYDKSFGKTVPSEQSSGLPF
jgi:hypothetical protein